MAPPDRERPRGYRDEALERSHPIAPLEVGIGVASDSQFYADISGRVVGVFASTFDVHPTETPIEVIVSFPDGASFRARGAVQFVRRAQEDQLPGLGIAFTRIDPSDYEIVAVFARDVRPPMLYDA